MYTVSFTLNKREDQVSDEEKEIIASHDIHYVKVHDRKGKSLYEAMIPSIDKLDLFKTLYQGRAPKIICVWNEDGSRYGMKRVKHRDEEGNISFTYEIEDPEDTKHLDYIFDQTEYLAQIPDKDDAGGRHVTPTEVHKFYGWIDRDFVN